MCSGTRQIIDEVYRAVGHNEGNKRASSGKRQDDEDFLPARGAPGSSRSKEQDRWRADEEEDAVEEDIDEVSAIFKYSYELIIFSMIIIINNIIIIISTCHWIFRIIV